MSQAAFTFYGALNYFLHRRQKNKTITQSFDWRASVKDMIESIAPPHPEIELILVNGRSVGWEYIVQDGDDIHVYPDYDAVSLPDKVRLLPPYQGAPTFILDTHLGRLASYLRMMGFDTLYRNDYEDDVLAQISHDEGRILLTRDIGVLKRGIVVYGYFVRHTNPRQRLLEISRRYTLTPYVNAFGRCMACNGDLIMVDKAAIQAHIPKDTYAYYEDFQQCQRCHKIYWKGSHYVKMAAIIEDVLAQVTSE